MTVTYSLSVSTVGFAGFARLLFRWRGGIYKLIFKEMVIFTFLYYALLLVHRLALSGWHRKWVFSLSIVFSLFLKITTCLVVELGKIRTLIQWTLLVLTGLIDWLIDWLSDWGDCAGSAFEFAESLSSCVFFAFLRLMFVPMNAKISRYEILKGVVFWDVNVLQVNVKYN